MMSAVSTFERARRCIAGLLLLCFSCGVADLDNPSSPRVPAPARSFEEVRAELIQGLYGSESLPSGGPQSRGRARREYAQLFRGAENLSHMEEMRFDLDFELSSTALVLHPVRRNGTFFVYHLGHQQGFEGSREIAAELLRSGYTVGVLAMPLMGPNRAPETLEIEGRSYRVGRTPWLHHAFVEPHRDGHPMLKLFLEPVHRLITAFRRSRPSIRRVHMAGLSGGGWTTHFAAALDPRISFSVAVAGSVPFHLRRGAYVNEVSDFEQNPSNWPGEAGYEELYAMAASGGRTHVQVLHQDDVCCFRAEGRELALSRYVERVKARLAGQGFFELIVQPQREHEILPPTLDLIAGKFRLRDVPPLVSW